MNNLSYLILRRKLSILQQLRFSRWKEIRFGIYKLEGLILSLLTHMHTHTEFSSPLSRVLEVRKEREYQSLMSRPLIESETRIREDSVHRSFL